jgi:uncharacterized membrane protein YobD (UPF0266 family)
MTTLSVITIHDSHIVDQTDGKTLLDIAVIQPPHRQTSPFHKIVIYYIYKHLFILLDTLF